MAESRTLPSVGLALLLAVGVWTFRGTLRNPFHFDDALFLQSPQVAEPGDPWYLLKPTQARLLTYLTFYGNYRLGGTSPFGYHLVNLLLHLANVVGLYFFAALLIRHRPGSFTPWLQRWLPLAAAGIFALHPVQTEPVNYVYQRSTLLAAGFTLLSMNSFLLAQRSRSRHAWLAVSSLAFCLAASSKESALILPLVWAALVWAESGGFPTLRQFLLRYRWIAAVSALAAAGAVWILYHLWSRGERNAGFALMDSSLKYLWAQIQVLSTYLRLLIWPMGLSIDHDFRPAPATSPYAWICLLALVCIVCVAVLIRRRNAMIAFLILAFLIFLAPTSSIVPSRDLLFEHRLYVPMTAAAILMAWTMFAAVSLLFKASRSRVAVSCLSVCLLLAVYAVLSERRTYIWGHNIRLWEDAVAKAPLKARAHYNLGIACLDSDRDRSRQELHKTVELDPSYAAAWYNLGWLAQVEGTYEAAKDYYRRALEADPKTWQARHNLGNLDILQGSLQEAMAEFQETIRLRPDYWPAYLNLATVQLQTGDSRSALQTLQSLKQLRWDLLEARYLSAFALVREARFREAEADLRYLTEHDSAGSYRDRIRSLRGQFPIQPKGPD